MVAVGIRALRQNATAYLRLVLAGETVEISSRGRPVALWIPLPKARGVRRLEAEARLTEPAGDVLELGPPLRAAPGAVLPSEALARARESER